MFLWTGTWDLDVEEKSKLAEMTEESEESEKTEWNRNTHDNSGFTTLDLLNVFLSPPDLNQILSLGTHKHPASE